MCCRAECQQQHGYLRMAGAGRRSGDPHEIFNAQFGPLGKTKMYMTRLIRQLSCNIFKYSSSACRHACRSGCHFLSNLSSCAQRHGCHQGLVSQACLERASLFYTEQKTLQFPLLLLRMEMHANAAIQDLQSTVNTISAELQGKGLTIVQVLLHSQQTFCS